MLLRTRLEGLYKVIIAIITLAYTSKKINIVIIIKKSYLNSTAFIISKAIFVDVQL